MVRVLIADDHQLVRQGIRLLLETAEDIEVVGEARNGYEAVEMTEQLLPDIVLMDADMPRLDGIQATRIIQSAHLPTRVIMLTMMDDANMMERAREQGAQAYLVKNSDRVQLESTIRTVYQSTCAQTDRNTTGGISSIE